ncbi:MAG TPA: hypothetical protein V6D09_05385, partial [Leptolyngbyaceae cyanobacterium]
AMIRYKPEPMDNNVRGRAMIRYQPEPMDRLREQESYRFSNMQDRMAEISPEGGVDEAANALQPILIRLAATVGADAALEAVTKAITAAGLESQLPKEGATEPELQNVH